MRDPLAGLFVSGDRRVLSLERRFADSVGGLVKIFPDLRDVPPFDEDFAEEWVQDPASVEGDTVVWGVAEREGEDGDELFWAPVRVAGGGGSPPAFRVHADYDYSRDWPDRWSSWEPDWILGGAGEPGGDREPTAWDVDEQPFTVDVPGIWHVDVSWRNNVGVYGWWILYPLGVAVDEVPVEVPPGGWITDPGWGLGHYRGGAWDAWGSMSLDLPLAPDVPWVLRGIHGEEGDVDVVVTGHLVRPAEVETLPPE